MRKEFSEAVEQLVKQDERIVFLTGDLGYNALENLQAVMGERFINTGVAEQNMVGVAAGMAHRGFKVFCYSIAPFVVYRCLEQFRNDVCLHQLPVFLVGNGGGYGYGIMGSTHHALEDLACLSSLQNVKCWIPAFSDEVAPSLSAMIDEAKPAYLRLGFGQKIPSDVPIVEGTKCIHQSPDALLNVVALGPVANNAWVALQQEDLLNKVNLFTVLNLPYALPLEYSQLFDNKPLVVLEEHVGVGGLAQQMSVALLQNGLHPSRMLSIHAEGYPNGLYGSQAYHQRQSGLAPQQIAASILNLL